MEAPTAAPVDSSPLASSNDEPDRLSRLPSELLDIIFSLLANDDEPLLGLISKRLLPFSRSTLYRDVVFSSQVQLAKFCQTIADVPALGKLVHSLDAAISAPQARIEAEGEDGGAAQEEEGSAEQVPAEKAEDNTQEASVEVDVATMLRLLQALPRLGRLGVRQPAMADLIVSSAFTLDHGKNLKDLRLCFASTPTPDAIRPLGHLPALTHLSILADATPDELRNPNNPWDVEPDDLFSDFSLPDIKHLRLGGSFIGPGLPMLALLFTNAREVQLACCPWDLVTTPIYSFLHSRSLTDLTIVQSPLVIEGRSVPIRSFSDSFSRFSNLTYLALDTAADLTPLFPHLVSPLPLEHLIFGEHSRPKVAQLKPLLLGPQKLADLRILEILSVPSGQSGEPLRAEDMEELDKVVQARMDGEKEATFGEWILPDWYEGFTSADAEGLLRSTSEQEVLVEGSFIEALIHTLMLGEQQEIARGERPALTEEDLNVPGPASREVKEAAYWAMAGVLHVTSMMGTRGRKTLQEILGVEGIDLEVLSVGEQ